MKDFRRPNETVTDEWLAEVASELQRQGLAQGILAKQVGASPSTISRLLGGEIPKSKFVEPISQVLGLIPTVARELEEIEERHADGGDPLYQLVDELRVLDPDFARSLEKKLRTYVGLRRFAKVED